MKPVKKFAIPESRKKKRIHRTVIISEGSELYPYCFNESGIPRSKEEAWKLLKDAPEEIKKLAYTKRIMKPELTGTLKPLEKIIDKNEGLADELSN